MITIHSEKPYYYVETEDDPCLTEKLKQIIEPDEHGSYYDTMADRFIATMKWSDDATEHERTLVIANVRGFASFLAREQ